MSRALTIAGLSLVVGLLPGLVFFRIPLLAREKRAALSADERAFWYVLISVTWSVTLTLAMAALSAYRLERLALINLATAGVIAVAFRGRLRLGSGATRPGLAVLFSLAMLAMCLWRFFPASEYVIGGKDPGVYVNEGINIDRTGTIFRRDPVVAAVPESARDLFFHKYPPTEYYSVRFMGVFINDPATGEVMPGFPHLFPASVAIGYGIAGIRGATNVVAIWAVLGVLAVYFFGARLIGRWPAFLASSLLVLHVIETWYGRYPNAEVVMQTMLFAGLLAFARAEQDDDRYFSWVAGVLCALLVFLRFDAFLVVASLLSAMALTWITKRRQPSAGFLLPVVAGIGIALLYYSGPLKAYFWQYKENLPSLNVALLAVAAGVVVVAAIGTQRTTVAPVITRYLPGAFALALAALAVYALFFRQPGGRLVASDAYALRMFREAYIFWPAFIAALAGYVVLGRRVFWRDPAFFIMFAVFCVFFFRKIHVVPEQFWLSRRFLPMILPGIFLIIAGAAIGSGGPDQKITLRRRLAGTLFVLFLGWQYRVAAAPVAAHVEYRGAIHSIDQLAARTTDRDLVLLESRGASDVHVLAPPLASWQQRSVLVIDPELPDREMFEVFLGDALNRYERVLIVASGGTDILSQHVGATPIASSQVLLPEYATTPWDEYPSGPRQKDLSYNVYRLTAGNFERRGFALDIGAMDDLSIVRFHARETADGRSIRWTMPTSFVSATGLTGREHEIALVMHDGGRPASAPPAEVEVFFDDHSLGRVRVTKGFQTYTLQIPADLVASAAGRVGPAKIKLLSTTWNPREFLGGSDDRELGVMIDRVEIH